MGTFGTQRLRRSGLSRKRARQSIETIEAYLGRAIGSNTCNNSPSKKTSCGQRLANDNERSLDKANKR